jgi:hypothetical protein
MITYHRGILIIYLVHLLFCLRYEAYSESKYRFAVKKSSKVSYKILLLSDCTFFKLQGDPKNGNFWKIQKKKLKKSNKKNLLTEIEPLKLAI